MSSLSVHSLNWSGISERLPFHVIFCFPLRPSCSSLFPSLTFLLTFHGSCQHLVTVAGQCRFRFPSECVCARVCVSATVNDILTFLQPLAECVAPPHSAYSGHCSTPFGRVGVRVCVRACVRACLCVCEQRHLRHTPYHNTDSAATTGTRWRLFSSQSVCFSSLSPAGCRKTPGGTARRGDGPMDV